MKNSTLRLICAALLMPLAGCATIVGSDTHTMPIVSAPSDASVKITDEKGVDIYKGNTPASVTLKKSDGSYFGKKTYTVTITKAGFATQTIPVTASPSGWYVGGNLLFGGLIGWLIVDPLSGKMYTLTPETIDVAKTAEGKQLTHNNTDKDGGITVVLAQDVPAELRSEMKPVN